MDREGRLVRVCVSEGVVHYSSSPGISRRRGEPCRRDLTCPAPLPRRNTFTSTPVAECPPPGEATDPHLRPSRYPHLFPKSHPAGRSRKDVDGPKRRPRVAEDVVEENDDDAFGRRSDTLLSCSSDRRGTP